jgi:hypothetical protein
MISANASWHVLQKTFLHIWDSEERRDGYPCRIPLQHVLEMWYLQVAHEVLGKLAVATRAKRCVAVL